MTIFLPLQQQSRVRLFFLMMALLLSGPAMSVELEVRLSHNPVTIDESFQLTVESNGSTDSDPDFSVLERDFQTISQSQSQNIQMINGKVSRSITWSLTLMARHTGRLTIPAIPFGSDSSKPLAILVESAAPPQEGLTGDDVFLKVEAEPAQAYQGQQILLSIQLYRAVSTDNASLSQPETDDPDILIKKLGEDAQHETLIGNRRYLVVERRYALFTRKTGTLNLKPLLFQGEVIKPGSRRDQLFGGPFSRFGSPGEIRRVQSNPISIEIKPAPQTAGEPWLPSSNLQLVENWGQERGQFTVGEPVTRTLMLFADGLTSAQLPEIKTDLPEGLKQYPDQPVLRDRESREGITGIRQSKVAIVPSRSGHFTLPAISINWWNVKKQRLETASIPEQRIEVLPVAGSETHSDPARELTATQPQQQAASSAPSDTNASNIWLWAATVFLGLGWTGTSFAWWYSAKIVSPADLAAKPAGSKPGKPNMRALRAACLANASEATAKALLEWSKSNWPKLSRRTLGTIACKTTNPELSREITQLERSLYAKTPSPWLGAGLWQQLEKEHGTASNKKELQEPIAPLYPT